MSAYRECEQCGYALGGLPPTPAGGCRCPECGSLQTGLEPRGAWWKGALAGTVPSAACWGLAWALGSVPSIHQRWPEMLGVLAIAVSVVAPFKASRQFAMRMPHLVLVLLWNAVVAAGNLLAALIVNLPNC